MRHLTVPLIAAILSHAVSSSAQPTETGEARAGRTLREVLTRTYAREMPGHTIVIADEDLGCARLMRAHVTPPLYPGTGVATLLIGTADGRTYGHHGAHDLSGLARACGWLTTAPSPETATRFVSLALYEGMIATRVPSALALAGGTLTITIRRAEPMSGREVEVVVVVIGATGPSTVRRTPITP